MTLNKRLANLNSAVVSGAQLPVPYCVTPVAQAQSLAYNYTFKPSAAGRIRHLSAFLDLTGTVTLDLLKNGSSVLVAAQTLTDVTTRTLEGLGEDATGEDQDFNTNSATNLAKLTYAKGDELTVRITTAAASTVVNGLVVVTCDEEQPAE